MLSLSQPSPPPPSPFRSKLLFLHSRLPFLSSLPRSPSSTNYSVGKTFKKPRRPFEKERLDAELKLVGEFGLRNKRELWRVQMALSKIRQVRRMELGYFFERGTRGKQERQQAEKRGERTGERARYIELDDMKRIPGQSSENLSASWTSLGPHPRN